MKPYGKTMPLDFSYSVNLTKVTANHHESREIRYDRCNDDGEKQGKYLVLKYPATTERHDEGCQQEQKKKRFHDMQCLKQV